MFHFIIIYSQFLRAFCHNLTVGQIVVMSAWAMKVIINYICVLDIFIFFKI